MTEKTQCPICGSKNAEKGLWGLPETKEGLAGQYKCARCGIYSITEELGTILRGQQKPLSLLSSWIREQNEIGKKVSLAIDVYFRLKKDLRMPTVSEKQLKIMQAFEKATHYPGELIKFKESFIALGWCKNREEYAFLTGALDRREMIIRSVSGIRITARGWDYLDEWKLKRPKESRKPFIAMWFDKSMDRVFDDAIIPAVKEAGYEQPMRIDRIEYLDKIDDKIIAEIRSSKFLIADLTGQRPCVYFEAGFALGLGIPVIWCVREDELDEVNKKGFDVRQFNFILWETEEDFKEKLLNRIKAVIV